MPIRRNGAQLNIANGIREFAVASPGATAVVDGEASLTYAALNERSSRVANAMLSLGLQPGNRVGFLCGNRLEYPEVAAGLAKCGMPMVPLNPRSALPELEFILGHSRCHALILDDALAGTVAPAAEAFGFDVILSIGGSAIGPNYEDALSDAAPTDPRIETSEVDPFTIAYTSGTTGDPKGIMVSHRSRVLMFLAGVLEWELGPGRRTVAVAPMYHGAGFAFAYQAVFTGGTVSMLRSFDPERLLWMIQQEGAHSVFLVPTHASLIRDLGEKVISRYDLSQWEVVYFNAAPLPHTLKMWMLDTFPGLRLHELYGSTEAGVVTNLRPPDARRKEMCVGTPWFLTEVRLVDEEGDEVGPGEVGELYSRSPYLMNGYWDNPEATQACTTADGFLTAGDLATFDDENFIYIIDRKKDMIISGGANVYPREVEEILLTHPSVRDVAVVGLSDDTWGERVTAFVVPATGVKLDRDTLDSHVRQHLAGYKVPREFHEMDALPRNASGKILRRDLRDQAASQ